MIGIDTNVPVRFLIRDDESQFEKARKLIKREVTAGRRVFVNQLVIMETEWVLRSRYAVPKAQMIEAISGLLDSIEIQFENEPSIEGGCPEFCVNGFSINSMKSVLQTGWKSGSAQLSSPGLASSTSC